MTTARQIITKALQKARVLVKGESPSGDEISDGLYALNAMIGSWSNNSLLIYSRTSESFALTGNQASYTIGSGGDFDTDRPLQILSAFIRIGSTDYELESINGVQYDKIVQKNIATAIPQYIFYDGNSPLGVITLNPVPTGGTLHIRSEKQISQFSTLDTDNNFPAGWDRALIFNLAAEIASEYGQEISQMDYQIAKESLANIKTATARNKNMNMFAGSRYTNDIDMGWYR